MLTVSEILLRKGGTALTISSGASVLDAARMMNMYRVGSLVVWDQPAQRSGAGTPVHGIITERDLLVRVIAAQRDPATTTVAEVMTTDVLCCGLNTSAAELRHLMQQRRIRHVPVVNGDRLCGLVSIGDLNAAASAEMSMHLQCMEEFVSRS